MRSFLGLDWLQFLVRTCSSTTLAKGICLCVIHQVLLRLQAHALIAEALGQGHRGLDGACMLHTVDADGLALLVEAHVRHLRTVVAQDHETE